MHEPNFDEHRERITKVAHEALDTNIAHMLADYQGLLALITKVAGPGGHINEAIELLTDRRDEARVIARNELETSPTSGARNSRSPQPAKPPSR